MKYSGFNFLCLTDIPEVLSKVTAGTSGYIHFILILVAALRTFPFIVIIYNDFAIIAANVAVV